MNAAFHALSEERQAGLRRVIAEARRRNKPHSEILGDQSQAIALHYSTGDGTFWQLKTDEVGVLAQGVWSKEAKL